MKHVKAAGPLPGPGAQGPGHGAASARAKPTLAEEIYDEFLVCKICLEGFKNPKCLECLHTFCENCIESHIQSESSYKKYSDYREFTCPLCRKRTQLPLGGVKKLPDNFLVSNLSETVGRRRLSRFPCCDICKTVDEKHRDGTAKCLDCAKMLCPSCAAEHQTIAVTSGHSVFDIEIEKDIGCAVHPDEMVRFYCVPCERCVCVLCTFKEHRQHRVTQFADAVTAYKATMEAMVDRCLEKVDRFDEHVTSLNRCESILVTVRERIRKTAASYVQDIERREQQLLAELDAVYGGDCLACLDRKQDVASHAENFRSACRLAKTILQGKDIELLLMRKDVQDKLDSLDVLKLKALPPTVTKVVEFVAGQLDFGHLVDHDRPLPTTTTPLRPRRRKSSTEIKPQKKAAASVDPEAPRGSVKDVSFSSDTSSDSASSDTDCADTASSTEAAADKRRQSSSARNRHRATVDRFTMTDAVKLVDRAVNTKARSMLNPNGSGRRASTKEQKADDGSDQATAGDRKATIKRDKMATIVDEDRLQ